MTVARRAVLTRNPYPTSNFQRTHPDRYWRYRQIGQPHFYRFLPVAAFSSVVRPPELTKDYKRLPNFKFSTGYPPKTIPFLYLFDTKIQFWYRRFGKTGRFPALRKARTDDAARHHHLNLELFLNHNRPISSTTSLTRIDTNDRQSAEPKVRAGDITTGNGPLRTGL